MTPALPPNAHPPHSTPSPHMHTASLSSVSSSSPSTPASTSAPGGGLSRLNSNANAFTPKRVVIKSESGQEVDLERFKKQAPATISTPIVPSSPARRSVPIRLETEEAKKKRLAEEQAEKAKKEAEEKAKKQAEEQAKRDAEEKVKREAEEKAKQEQERKRKEEEEMKRREEEEARERERERKRKEEEEAEAERLRKEVEEQARKEEEERVARDAEEEKAKAAVQEVKAEPEEGEVQEPEQAVEATDEATKEEARDKVSDKAPLRIDTSLTSSDGKRRPGRLDLSSTKNQTIPVPLPSALATARIIEDIGSIQYPEGIKSPKPELNTNAKQGKFRCVSRSTQLLHFLISSIVVAMTATSFSSSWQCARRNPTPSRLSTPSVSSPSTRASP